MKTISNVKEGDILYRINRRGVHNIYKVVVTKIYGTFDGKIHIKVEDGREMYVDRSDTRTYKIGASYIYAIMETEKREPFKPTTLVNIDENSLIYYISVWGKTITKRAIPIKGVCITPEIVIFIPENENESPLLVYSVRIQEDGRLAAIDPIPSILGVDKDEVEKEFSKTLKGELNPKLEMMSELERKALTLQSLIDQNESQEFIRI